MYFENTNYAISHSWYDSKRAIIQLGKLPQCTKADTAQPWVPAQHNQITQPLLILNKNSGNKTAHTLKSKAWTGSNTFARMIEAMSFQSVSAGKHLQRKEWLHTFLDVTILP